ncbi:CHAD domain-containing protein [Pseudomonas sp. S9]|uniref:CHAD domain-containing protein n=1 Tax=Pseudomonas sp. S9 TaxID=686578 RepID=UPI0002557469|nr:CHAD domain-containing protein [Pseudomonas sp. S9]
MSAFADRISAQVLKRQVSLFACAARMQACTDVEALHDLRINLRRLRSLLKPLRGLPACDQLQLHAAQLGKLTGPVRELEVLVAELQRKQQASGPVEQRRQRVVDGYLQTLHSDQLSAFWQALDDWPVQWRLAERDGSLKRVESKLESRLIKAQRRLVEALADPLHDWHDLRLLVKRVRYNAEAYPKVARLDRPGQKALKQAQEALGQWHDLLQWLLLSETETDLASCVSSWKADLLSAEIKVAKALASLRKRLLANE